MGRIWSEIRCDHFDDIQEHFTVDAWVTGDDDEEGKVIATISQEGEVTYRDERAYTDLYAQDIIQYKVKELLG